MVVEKKVFRIGRQNLVEVNQLLNLILIVVLNLFIGRDVSKEEALVESLMEVVLLVAGADQVHIYSDIMTEITHRPWKSSGHLDRSNHWCPSSSSFKSE